MNPARAEQAAVAVGAITSVIGTGLLATPSRVGPLLGLDDPRAARAIGVADLALVPGLMRGRRRWEWVALRCGLNVPTALYVL